MWRSQHGIVGTSGPVLDATCIKNTCRYFPIHPLKVLGRFQPHNIKKRCYSNDIMVNMTRQGLFSAYDACGLKESLC